MACIEAGMVLQIHGGGMLVKHVKTSHHDQDHFDHHQGDDSHNKRGDDSHDDHHQQAIHIRALRLPGWPVQLERREKGVVLQEEAGRVHRLRCPLCIKQSLSSLPRPHEVGRDEHIQEQGRRLC
mmetsp:Transcript_76856/g.156165  ORF Transcript_76856/g.156165 Transcript_76856/m.156165 type:complete len:124 (+) Transcript_76856:759-1130(+)